MKSIVDVRFCKSPSRGIANLLNPSKDLEQPRFSGVMGFMINTLLESGYANFPYIVNRSASLFDYQVTWGCAMALAHNESDFAIGIFNYPPNQDMYDLEKVLPFEVAFEDQVV